MRVHVVTDSGAQFAHAQVTTQYPLTVVPNKLQIGGRSYLEGVDIDAAQALELVSHQPTPPRVVAPAVDDYVALYTRLAYHNDVVISVHMSRRLSDSWQNAHDAAAQVSGHVKVYVIDTMTLDAAQGMIVRTALQAAEQLRDGRCAAEEAVEQVRGATERVYAVYYTPKLDYLVHHRLISPSHAVLNGLYGTIPLLSVDDGTIALTEKTRSKAQSVDRLVEFASEFEAIEDALILQSGSFASEQISSLQEQLTNLFEDQHFPRALYGASLASLIGVNAVGLAILEKSVL